MTVKQAMNKFFEELDQHGWQYVASTQKESDNVMYCVVVNLKNEFVTYLFNIELGGFYHGHYFNNLEDAMTDYDARRE